MLQILQNIANGKTSIVEVPSPKPLKGHALIRSSISLVSAGTERMLINFGKANWVQKARSQPDKVKMVLDKVKTDGISSTFDAITSKLDQPLPLGYCNVGKIIDPNDTKFKVGDRVVSNGSHAELVRVPKNLISKIPDNVDDKSAAFTVLGAIALQGIRLLKPTIGETIVVTGLGLIGLLSVQILIANGCRVIGIDLDSKKCKLAKKFGAEVVDLSKNNDSVKQAVAFSRGRGVDGVLITASSKSNDIVHEAAMMCRKRGRIILVGVVGLELRRDDFYEKELSFQVSCSYGPGRYDIDYEENGNDYPIGYVRWTEQRNFEAILDLMSKGLIDCKSLITHEFEFSLAEDAYKELENSSSLGILLKYKNTTSIENSSRLIPLRDKARSESIQKTISFIGGGNYASRVLIPAFKKTNAKLDTIVTSGGVSASHHGKKFGFLNASTNINDALNENTNAVIIATQHNLHSSQVITALKYGKHVLVEKPLALTHQEINDIEKAQAESNCMIMVGYNRRFSPHIIKAKKLLSLKPMPKTFIMTMSPGEIGSDHWIQDKNIGGGRIIGEACHYIDLMRFLAGSPIADFSSKKMGDNNFTKITEDKAIITLSFEDGSIGAIHYLANGGKSFPKERIEVFCDNAVLQIDNFRRMKGFGWKDFSKMNLLWQDKGQFNLAKTFINSLDNPNNPPIPIGEVFEVARYSIDIAEKLRK